MDLKNILPEDGPPLSEVKKYIEKYKNDAFFVPNNIKVGSHFFIPKNKLNNAKHNDRVIIEFVEWPLNTKNPIGRVISIISKKPSLKTEIESKSES